MKTKFLLPATLAIALALPVAAIMIAKAAGLGPGLRPPGPCDLYAAAGTPCVAAHSTTRALLASYSGPLYQVTRQSDGRTLDIGVAVPSATDGGGYADASVQDSFCANTLCVISTIYDQSGKGNHLIQAPPGTFKGTAKGGFDTLPIADMAPVTIAGHKVYGVYIMPGMGFRNNDAAGIAINDEPEGVYYVIDGTHYDSGCCFDYGNASANGRAVGTGTMETVYFGTATAWGTGSGRGPWIMSDMEAGLFSGYNAKQNAADPTIESWRFVTAVVNGGGGNRWELRGGDAQEGGLTTFYSGVRPGSSNDAAYFPMHKKGGILLGNGGDNGNGSAGTFYEGVMTTGYPSQAATDAVQSNIVASKYDVQQVNMSQVATFTPGSSQEVTVTFKNTTDTPAAGVKLSLSPPVGWKTSTASSKTMPEPVMPGATVSAVFTITSPGRPDAGFVTGKAEWKIQGFDGMRGNTMARRVRSTFPVKINEVRLGGQFVELYNASEKEVDISGWTLTNTQSQWAPVKLASIPARTKLAARGFYLLGLSSSGLSAPAGKGVTNIFVRSITGFVAGQKIEVDGESRTISAVGTAASAMTTLFIPVSTGPWLTIPAGSTNVPVTSATGFEVGQEIGLDLGGNFEIMKVTQVGKAATQTTLSTATEAGTTTIKVAAYSNINIGDTLTIGTGGRKEHAVVTGLDGGSVDVVGPLKFDHIAGVEVSDVGAGISFLPATKFPHRSGDAVQALGTGVELDKPLAEAHETGAPVVNSQAPASGYQGPPQPDQWFGGPLSTSAGSLALMDASGRVVVDAIVFGSRQSSSSANGTITSPELATLAGNQGQGGCIVVVPNAGRGGGSGRGAPPIGATNRSMGRVSDGADTGRNCDDFQLQPATPGAANQRAQ